MSRGDPPQCAECNMALNVSHVLIDCRLYTGQRRAHRLPGRLDELLECQKKRRISQRGYRRPNSAELVAEYKTARRRLNKAIKDSKRQCWEELINEVDKDPWGRPYKVAMTRLKNQTTPSPTCPQFLKTIVTALFPRQRKFEYPVVQCELEEIPPVSENELMEACNRVGSSKAPGLDGIPNIA
ncbi:uncharacterized protein LOC124358590 [Homalodisca vitripennis]|uniref:uncharacterized protein LOC124358590 n=1 Tax=Homalodisca vitripennis TaxID=197043 RepID=UPI001EEB099E|nr:uncharacterized protein LOC124358590 [Homalodisca vitripennis]